MAALAAKVRGMAAYTFIVAMSVAGYLRAPGWLIIAGALGLTLADWGLRGLSPRSRMAWTTKTTTYFVAGVVANVILAALAFAAGRAARLLLG